MKIIGGGSERSTLNLNYCKQINQKLKREDT